MNFCVRLVVSRQLRLESNKYFPHSSKRFYSNEETTKGIRKRGGVNGKLMIILIH